MIRQAFAGRDVLVTHARRPQSTGKVEYGKDWYKQTRQNARRFNTVKEELGKAQPTRAILILLPRRVPWLHFIEQMLPCRILQEGQLGGK